MDKQKYNQLALSFGISEKDFSQLLSILKQWGWTLADNPTSDETEHTMLLEESTVEATLNRSLDSGNISEYLDIQQLGQGGMGEVRKVQDRQLNRMVALKTLHQKWQDDPVALIRFLKEAQLTSQLQHPGIVPVFEFGHKDDGSPYFTMPEIKGRTFGSLLKEMRENQEQQSFSRQRLNDFHQVCKTIAYAHARGVIHCDIKPNNIMLGEFGEVYILDWGLALVTEPLEGFKPIQILHIRDKDIIGTPQYMSPEQIAGQISRISFPSDVYSLGILLYQILMNKKPFEGNPDEILELIKAGKKPDIPRNTGIPSALIKIYEKATEYKAKERYEHAGQMAIELENWLIGAQQEERANELLQMAKAKQPEIEQLQLQARVLTTKSTELKQHIKAWSSEEEKLQLWAMQDEAISLENQAKQAELDREQLLQGALLYSPNSVNAHRELSLYYQRLHQLAEHSKDQVNSERMERMLRSHTRALPTQDPVRLQTIQYLKGDGAFSLKTNPNGALVNIYSYREINRQLKPTFIKTVRNTPIIKHPLPIGSYLLEIVHPNHETVLYPIFIERLSHWDGESPVQQEATGLWLPPKNYLTENQCYVPSGWFVCGGDYNSSGSAISERIWVDGFIIDKFPTTNAQYIQFLNSLMDNGQEELALQCAPQHNYGSERQLYKQDSKGYFFADVDAENDMWEDEWPVVMIDWHSSVEYAKWRSQNSPHHWRLPLELEWEKAARGVDGRFFPWGDFFDASRCCNRHSHPIRQLLSTVDAFPLDKSPYGVRGMAGNSGDWCADPYYPTPRHYKNKACFPSQSTVESREHIYRGGSWAKSYNELRLACRSSNIPTARSSSIGVRCATSINVE